MQNSDQNRIIQGTVEIRERVDRRSSDIRGYASNNIMRIPHNSHNIHNESSINTSNGRVIMSPSHKDSTVKFGSVAQPHQEYVNSNQNDNRFIKNRNKELYINSEPSNYQSSAPRLMSSNQSSSNVIFYESTNNSFANQKSPANGDTNNMTFEYNINDPIKDTSNQIETSENNTIYRSRKNYNSTPINEEKMAFSAFQEKQSPSYATVR